MKKHLFKVMPLLLLTALTACGSTGRGSSQEGGKWWKTTGEIVRDADGNIVFDEITINLTHVICGYDQNGFEDMIKEFNRQYNRKIKIVPEALDQLTIDNNVQQRIQQNMNAPDLVFDHQKTHRNFAMNKLIQPIDECFQAADIPLSKDMFVEKFAGYCNLGYGDGSTIFNYPVDAQSTVGYYNKQLLAQLGEQVPLTRDDLIRISKRAKDELGLAHPLGITNNSEFFKFYAGTTALDQNGFEFYNPTDYKVNWTTDEQVLAFSRGVHSIYDWKNTDGICDYKYANNTQDFINGKMLFLIDLPFNCNTVLLDPMMEKYSLPDRQAVKEQLVGGFSTAKMFANADAPEATKDHIFGDSHAFFVPKQVEDITKKAAIATFIDWFTSQGSIGADWAELGHAAGLKRIINSDEYKNDYHVNNFTTKWYPDLNKFDTPDITPYYQVVFDDNGIYNAFITALNGGDISMNTLRAILTEAQRVVNGTIDLMK